MKTKIDNSGCDNCGQHFSLDTKDIFTIYSLRDNYGYSQKELNGLCPDCLDEIYNKHRKALGWFKRNRVMAWAMSIAAFWLWLLVFLVGRAIGVST